MMVLDDGALAWPTFQTASRQRKGLASSIGWIVVAAAFAVTFVGFGSAYTFSLFVGLLGEGLRGVARFSLVGVLIGSIAPSVFRHWHDIGADGRPLGGPGGSP